eukprot:m.274042 g.274042  ORF g.274042 m.274042 type:complete len:83 (+) comp40582_c0_seq9:1206-1454(+)
MRDYGRKLISAIIFYRTVPISNTPTRTERLLSAENRRRSSYLGRHVKPDIFRAKYTKRSYRIFKNKKNETHVTSTQVKTYSH